jgi:CHAT domain-containing protein/tetratricopeptide (TPR) repeat protein
MNGQRPSIVLMVGCGLFGVVFPVVAQPTTAEKVKQLAESGEKADLLIRDGKFAEAIEPATECVKLSREIDGPKHWRTFDAVHRLKLAELAKGLPGEKQKQLREALGAEAQAKQWEDDKPKEAIKLARTALAGYGEVLGEETVEAARVWFLIGGIGLGSNDAKGAKEANEKALTIQRKILPESHPDIGKSLYHLGSALNRLGNKKEAVECYKEAVRIWKAGLGENDQLIAMGMNKLGAVEYELRNYEAARQNFTEVLAIRRKSLPNDHHRIAGSLTNLGVVQHSLREYEAARQSFTEALAIYRKVLPRDHPDIAVSLTYLGVVQYALREYVAARQSYTEALELRRKVLSRDHPDIAMSLAYLGNVQYELRDYVAARQSHTEALAIRRKTLPKDHPSIAHSLNDLGIVQHDLREYEAARESHTEALAIRRKSLPRDHPDIAMSLNNLGVVQHSLREYEAARQSHTEALAIRRKSLPKDHPSIPMSLNNLGNVQQSLREYEAARQSYTEALAIYRKVLPRDHPDIADSLNNLGSVQYELREYEAARESHTEALAIRRKVLPRDHPDIAGSLNNLALLELCSSGTSARTIDLLEEALGIERTDLTRLAGSQAEAEQLTAAYESQETQHLYLSAMTGSVGDPPAAYQQLAGFKGAVTARQRWTRGLRNTRDATTAELLRKMSLVDRELLGSSLLVRSTDRDRRLEDPKKRLSELQEERKGLERQLSVHSEAYRLFLEKARIGGDEVRTALPAGTCLIDFREYVHYGPLPKGAKGPIHESHLLAYLVEPGAGKVVMVRLGRSDPIASSIDRWRASYGVGRQPAAGEPDPAVELRKTLWEPLRKHLGKEVQTVLISPDGPLNGLPFAALPGSKEGTFLLHEYAFAVVPVPILLPEMMAKKPARLEAASLLLMGGIDFGDGKDAPSPGGSTKLPAVPRFNTLAGTESEVNDLCAHFEKAFPDLPAPRIFKKDRATKAAFLQNASKYSFIHLATHGFFAQESEKSALDPGPEAVLRDFRMDRLLVGRNPGLLSGIVFAGVNNPDRPKEDGVLTALEAGELDLNESELVVLSACETGRGKVAGGEGVLGLQRAFQMAGVRAAVTSLWKVDDLATQALMTRFHRNLWEKRMGKLEALREAQLWLLKEGWKHPELKLRSGLVRPEVKENLKEGDAVSPYFWAAFVLSGDWR